LFTEHVVEPHGVDDSEELRPEMSLVGVAFAFSCGAERLARTRSCNARLVVGPSGKTQGKGPACDSCEEVQLGKSHKLRWLYFGDAALIHDSIRYFAGCNQITNPLRGVFVDLIVEIHGQFYSSTGRNSSSSAARP